VVQEVDSGVKKILLISNTPTPYRLPLFSEVCRQLSAAGYESLVVFLAGEYKRRKWKISEKFDFPHIVLEDPRVQLTQEKMVSLSFSLIPVLYRQRPSLIITAGFSFASMLVCSYSILTRTPYVLWSGEIDGEVKKFRWLRRLVRMLLIRRAASLVAYGTEAESYLSSFKQDATIFKAWNTVDTTFFSKEHDKLSKQKDEIFRELGLSAESVHILTVGYLVHRKGVDILLEAVGRMSNRNFVLHVVGDGPERQKLESLKNQLNLEGRVFFWGYKQNSELPRFYAVADVFVFTTRFDIWGLVLEEAMACGLPVVASSRAGATVDLVKDKENGFIVDPEDVEGVSELIERLICDRNLRETFGKKSKVRILEQFSIQHSAAAFTDVVRHTLEKG
jgi:glycosyltransferase involved in cell wall biosynthesis